MLAALHAATDANLVLSECNEQVQQAKSSCKKIGYSPSVPVLFAVDCSLL